MNADELSNLSIMRNAIKIDATKGGTNLDCSQNERFCSHCYLEGEFTKPYLNVVDMQKKVKLKMLNRGVPGLFANIFARRVLQLERWKS